jgi:hypothetical protein
LDNEAAAAPSPDLLQRAINESRDAERLYRAGKAEEAFAMLDRHLQTLEEVCAALKATM